MLPDHYAMEKSCLLRLLVCRVSVKDIAMLGKWNNDHMTMSYINSIPLGAVMARAGFHDHLHMIARSTIAPPDELLACIFPGIEEMHEQKNEVGFYSVFSLILADA